LIFHAALILRALRSIVPCVSIAQIPGTISKGGVVGAKALAIKQSTVRALGVRKCSSASVTN
jgi:hypothetical protein